MTHLVTSKIDSCFQDSELKSILLDILNLTRIETNPMDENITQKNFTPYQDINEILFSISNGIQVILGEDVVGLYLFGSLTYGDFNTGSSDVDLVTIIEKPLNQDEIALVKQLHQQIAKQYPKWGDRLECSYTAVDMLKEILPPKAPRPYYGGGIFYDQAPYGNEWIINNYLLYQYGISLIGRPFNELIKSIEIIEVQKACIRDLFQEWQPKINDVEWLNNSHYQSYLVLNLCRILYTVICGKTSSKKVSAEWVKNNLDCHWRELIEAAESWKYGKIMSLNNEAIEFIKFTINKIEETNIFQQHFVD